MGDAGRPNCDDTYIEASARFRTQVVGLHLRVAAFNSVSEEDMNQLHKPLAKESGQTMAEYAVVLGVITIAVVATFSLLSSTTAGLLSSVIPLI
jgi:Flp pilus assembly pilin Flp